jgi:hypothetical protein
VREGTVVEVGEVARTNADNETLVPRERLKQEQYRQAEIQSKVVKLPKKPQPTPLPSPQPTSPPPIKPPDV